jgi:hypothetical protein
MMEPSLHSGFAFYKLLVFRLVYNLPGILLERRMYLFVRIIVFLEAGLRTKVGRYTKLDALGTSQLGRDRVGATCRCTRCQRCWIRGRHGCRRRRGGRCHGEVRCGMNSKVSFVLCDMPIVRTD